MSLSNGKWTLKLDIDTAAKAALLQEYEYYEKYQINERFSTEGNTAEIVRIFVVPCENRR